ncbi:hypothetical protein Tco_0671758 [Tanacetum coccineum]
MSSGLSASMAEVAAMSKYVFRKRFRSSYKSSPSFSPPDLPSQKRYQGTSELVEDSEEEDEEIEESLDSDSVSKDVDDEGPTAEDEDLAVGDEGRGPRRGGGGCKKKQPPGGQHQAALVVRTAVSAPLGLGYGALRRRELALEEDQPTLTTWTDPEDGMVYIDVPAYPPPTPPVQTPASPEWTTSLLPICPSPSVVPSPISSPMISLILGSSGRDTRGLNRDHYGAVILEGEELSLLCFERSLEYEQERVAVTFGAIWRPVLALNTHGLHVGSELTILELAEVGDSIGEGSRPEEMRMVIMRRANRKVIDHGWSRGVSERVVMINWET